MGEAIAAARGVAAPVQERKRETRRWRDLFVPQTRPTMAGAVLFLLSVFVGSAAYQTGSNVLFLALAILLASLLLSGLLCWLNFAETSWELRVPPVMRAGEMATISLILRNGKRFLPTYSLWFNVRAHTNATHERVHLCGRLNPMAETTLSWHFRPRKRGCETLEVRGLETEFPFGFLRKILGEGATVEALVLPARVPYRFRRTTGANPGHGRPFSRRREAPQGELRNLREYVPGDSLKNINWKASARLRTLLVRQDCEDIRAAYTLHLPTGPGVWPDEATFDRACGFAASLLEDLLDEGFVVTLAAGDASPRTLAEPAMKTEGLKHLARLNAEDPAHALSAEARRHQVVRFAPGPEGTVIATLHGRPAGQA